MGVVAPTPALAVCSMDRQSPPLIAESGRVIVAACGAAGALRDPVTWGEPFDPSEYIRIRNGDSGRYRFQGSPVYVTDITGWLIGAQSLLQISSLI